jgi:hypothetical protein
MNKKRAERVHFGPAFLWLLYRSIHSYHSVEIDGAADLCPFLIFFDCILNNTSNHIKGILAESLGTLRVSEYVKVYNWDVKQYEKNLNDNFALDDSRKTSSFSESGYIHAYFCPRK